MKTLLTLLILMSSTLAWTQRSVLPKGVDYEQNVTPISDANKLSEMENWYFIQEDDVYCAAYDLTPVGVKHMIERFYYLMGENHIDQDKIMDNSLLPSYADGLFDYENVSLGLKVGGAEISLYTQTNAGWTIWAKSTGTTGLIMMYYMQE